MRRRPAWPFNPALAGLLSGVCFTTCLLLLRVSCLFGQADSREEQIQREREEAHRQARPETMNKVEKAV
jgi:hypothetical protein